MDKMSFKQFHTKFETAEPHIYGGWSAPRALEQHDLDVWAQVLALPDTGAELAAKGAPTSVKSQIVAGLKFKFTFADGSTVIVLRSLKFHISIVNH